jgi:hypothetical protein
MRRPAVGLCAVFALYLAACEKPSVPPPATGALALATSPIDTLLTLGAWMHAHAGDVVTDSVPTGALAEVVCRTAMAKVQLAGRTLTRSAVFGVPPTPAGEVLPADTTQLAERFCRLRGVWYTAMEPDSARAIAVADSLSHIVDSSLGASRAGIAMSGAGTGLWSGARSWTGHGTTVVMGIAPPDARTRPDGANGDRTDTIPRRVVLVTFAPGSGLDRLEERVQNAAWDRESEAEHASTLALADSAITWSGVPTISADLHTALAHAHLVYGGAPARDPQADSALVRAVAAARDSSRSLEPSRRAATLLATDLVLTMAAGSFDADTTKDDVKLRRALQAAGAPYTNSPLGGADVYTRDFLWEAYHADSLGRAGRAAFLELLSLGMAKKANCGDGPNGFDRVIDAGERALRAGAQEPEIHHYLGLAYADVVALARGAGDEYADSSEFRPRAAISRTRAIEHFRAALAGLNERRMRREAWRGAMGLMLALPVSETRFFCVYD